MQVHQWQDCRTSNSAGPLLGLGKLRSLRLLYSMPGINAHSPPGVVATKMPDVLHASQRHSLLCCRQPDLPPTSNKARIVQDF